MNAPKAYRMIDGDVICFDFDIEKEIIVFDIPPHSTTREWEITSAPKRDSFSLHYYIESWCKCNVSIKEPGTYNLRLKKWVKGKPIELNMALEFHGQEEQKVEEKKETVDHPSHYNIGKIECIEYVEDQGMGCDFCLGNAIKYITRAKHKGNELEDLKKAIWYLERRVGQIGTNENKECFNLGKFINELKERVKDVRGLVSVGCTGNKYIVYVEDPDEVNRPVDVPFLFSGFNVDLQKRGQ